MYYFHFMMERPELRRGRCQLFILTEDSNMGKELGAATISLLDLQHHCRGLMQIHVWTDGKNLPLTVKAHEVQAFATSLQLFSKVDLQTVSRFATLSFFLLANFQHLPFEKEGDSTSREPHLFTIGRDSSVTVVGVSCFWIRSC